MAWFTSLTSKGRKEREGMEEEGKDKGELKEIA